MPVSKHQKSNILFDMWLQTHNKWWEGNNKFIVLDKGEWRQGSGAGIGHSNELDITFLSSSMNTQPVNFHIMFNHQNGILIRIRYIPCIYNISNYIVYVYIHTHIYHIFFIHSSVEGHLGWLHIVNWAFKNINIDVSLQYIDFKPFG